MKNLRNCYAAFLLFALLACDTLVNRRLRLKKGGA